MKQVLLLLCLMAAGSAFCQSATENFSIQALPSKTPNSLYNSVAFMDAREDITSMGFVQHGGWRKKFRVDAETPLSVQLKELLETVIDSAAGSGQLLFQLRHLRFYEITQGGLENGFCHFKAALYAKENSRYRPLKKIDTLLTVHAKDATPLLMQKAKRIFSEFLQSGLRQQPSDTLSFSTTGLLRMDNFEKESLPLYTNTAYRDGLYLSYASFKRQIPDRGVDARINKDKVAWVKTPDSQGNYDLIDDEDEIYAFVKRGRPFIRAAGAYYPLIKVYNDYYFTGYMPVSKKVPLIIASAVLSVALIALDVYLLATITTRENNNGGYYAFTPILIPTFNGCFKPRKQKFTVLIDHTSGWFIRQGF